MEKTGILLQSRMSSTRLPGKSLMEIGGHPLIYYVVKRLEPLNLPIVVCTSTDATDDPLVDYLKKQNIDFFRGDLNNVLKRFIDAATIFGFDNIFRITGDNPFVDVDYILEKLDLIYSYNYVDAIHGDGLIYGTGFEFVKLNELKKIDSIHEYHTEHVTSYLRENMQELFLKLVPADIKKMNNEIFLSCDYAEDFTLISFLFMYFDYRFDVPVYDILKLFHSYKGLNNINKVRHTMLT